MARRRTLRFVKTLIVLFFLSVIWIQLHIIRLGSSNGGAAGNSNVQMINGHGSSMDDVLMMPSQPLVLYVNRMVVSELHLNNNNFSTTTTTPPVYNSSRGDVLNLTDIKVAVDAINAEERVINLSQFGPLEADDVVIVVQVHTRVNYLQNLISSLRKAKDVEKVLLIFSHDVYDSEINAIVQAVDFCKVLQIFYPFSIQLHPNVFPGQDPKDCGRDTKRAEAARTKCNNADFPDLYGHYREAKFTQTKHHWWWKINHVFDGLRVTRNHTGLVVFLEEDHYVVEDFLPVLRLMEATRQRECKHCNTLCLGSYMKIVNFVGDASKAEIWQWISSKHNMGMAFNRTTWVDIRSCSGKFCFFDDYNWDWSLQYISATCMKHKLTVLLMKAPRVFHIGECGVHHKKKDCSSNAEMGKVTRVLSVAKPHLYPKKLMVTHSTKRIGKVPKGNGGWGDIRDRQLCIWHTNVTDIR